MSKREYIIANRKWLEEKAKEVEEQIYFTETEININVNV